MTSDRLSVKLITLIILSARFNSDFIVCKTLLRMKVEDEKQPGALEYDNLIVISLPTDVRLLDNTKLSLFKQQTSLRLYEQLPE